jgi:uncharacterized membrane protein
LDNIDDHQRDARRDLPCAAHLCFIAHSLFFGALTTDIVYALTTDMIWADFSDLLLAVGVGMGVLAAIVGLVDTLTTRRAGLRRPVVPLVFGALIVLALGFLNNLVHSRDAWTSAVPRGLALSVVSVLLILLTIWADAAAVRRLRLRHAGGRP